MPKFEVDWIKTRGEIAHSKPLTCTLMTLQGSDTVTSIFKYSNFIKITSLRLLKMA